MSNSYNNTDKHVGVWMSDTKPVTLEDGTPVPDDTEDLRNASDFYGDPTAPNCDNLTVVSYITEILALRERIARAEAREKRLRDALEEATGFIENMQEDNLEWHRVYDLCRSCIAEVEGR